MYITLGALDMYTYERNKSAKLVLGVKANTKYKLTRLLTEQLFAMWHFLKFYNDNGKFLTMDYDDDRY